MQAKVAMMEVGKVLQKAGPYVVLEVVLPGGTLFALLLYLHRTGRLGKFGRLLLWGLNRTGPRSHSRCSPPAVSRWRAAATASSCRCWRRAASAAQKEAAARGGRFVVNTGPGE